MPVEKKFLPRILNAIPHSQHGDRYDCNCPAHDDRIESLTITDNGDDLLLYCHGGCSFEEILNALKNRGLVDSLEKKRGGGSSSKKVIDFSKNRIHTYRYLDGTECVQKVVIKRGDKKMPFFRRHLEDGTVITEGATKGIEIPLYALPELMNAVNVEKTVYLCEGEKDVDTILSLGLVGTTNYEGGAGKWKQRYNKFFVEKSVVILEDHDETGRERTAKLTEALTPVVRSLSVVRFPELPTKGDITDYFELYGRESTLTKLSQVEVIKDAAGWAPPRGREKALFEDYISFVWSLPAFKEIRRCILTDELVYHASGKRWRPLLNQIPYIKSHARAFNKFFTYEAFKDHLEAQRIDHMKPQLRIDIPDWDGRDRIAEMADVFRFSDVSSVCFYELIRQWGANIFERLKDENLQPFTPIFQGAQGLGKDVLISALTGGLGDHVRNLNIGGKDVTETKKQLHSALVFLIPEFDKTGKIDIAALKDLANNPVAESRLSYDMRSEERPVRASFIASCNQKNILVDETGNRRWWVFPCEFLGFETKQIGSVSVGTGNILKDYPGLFCRPDFENERAQIMAQFRELGDKRFRADRRSIAEMDACIANLQPRPIQELILEEWDSSIAELGAIPDRVDPVHGYRLYEFSKVEKVITSVQRNYGKSRRTILAILKETRQYRHKSGRFYFGILPPMEHQAEFEP